MARGSRVRKDSTADPFEELTWDDLQEWAGNRVLSRGQSYHRSRRVQELGQTQSGELVAWVQGEKRYATQVSFRLGDGGNPSPSGEATICEMIG